MIEHIFYKYAEDKGKGEGAPPPAAAEPYWTSERMTQGASTALGALTAFALNRYALKNKDWLSSLVSLGLGGAMGLGGYNVLKTPEGIPTKTNPGSGNTNLKIVPGSEVVEYITGERDLAKKKDTVHVNVADKDIDRSAKDPEYKAELVKEIAEKSTEAGKSSLVPGFSNHEVGVGGGALGGVATTAYAYHQASTYPDKVLARYMTATENAAATLNQYPNTSKTQLPFTLQDGRITLQPDNVFANAYRRAGGDPDAPASDIMKKVDEMAKNISRDEAAQEADARSKRALEQRQKDTSLTPDEKLKLSNARNNLNASELVRRQRETELTESKNLYSTLTKDIAAYNEANTTVKNARNELLVAEQNYNLDPTNSNATALEAKRSALATATTKQEGIQQQLQREGWINSNGALDSNKIGSTLQESLTAQDRLTKEIAGRTTSEIQLKKDIDILSQGKGDNFYQLQSEIDKLTNSSTARAADIQNLKTEFTTLSNTLGTTEKNIFNAGGRENIQTTAERIVQNTALGTPDKAEALATVNNVLARYAAQVQDDAKLRAAVDIMGDSSATKEAQNTARREFNRLNATMTERQSLIQQDLKAIDKAVGGVSNNPLRSTGSDLNVALKTSQMAPAAPKGTLYNLSQRFRRGNVTDDGVIPSTSTKTVIAGDAAVRNKYNALGTEGFITKRLRGRLAPLAVAALPGAAASYMGYKATRKWDSAHWDALAQEAVDNAINSRQNP